MRAARTPRLPWLDTARVEDNGTVVLRPATLEVRELRGMLHRKGLTPLTIEEMNAVIRRRGSGRV